MIDVRNKICAYLNSSYLILVNLIDVYDNR